MIKNLKKFQADENFWIEKEDMYRQQEKYVSPTVDTYL
jgi:hypothetical protein